MTVKFNTPSLDAQIFEVDREIKVRLREYPILVHKRAMKQQEADYCIDCMRAVLESLRKLKDAGK